VSAKKHKSDYFILSILGLLTASVLIWLVVRDMVRPDRAARWGSRTTYSTNVDGAIVPYTLFQRLGISVARSEKVLLRDVLDNIDVLFQLDPLIPMRSDETEDIRAWVASGGVLVCTEIPIGLARDLRALDRNRVRFSRPRRPPRRSDKAELSELTSIPVEHSRLPLARDVSHICFQTPEVLHINAADPNKPDASVEPLLVDSRGVRIAAHKFGRGRFIVLSDSSFLANGQIGKSDNSVLAANLVGYALSKAGGTRVLFDEYHLGSGPHTSGFSVLSRLLFTTAAGWAVLSLTVAGVFYLIYRGRRFGSRRDLEKTQRRSKLDYIYGVGATYRAAGANRLALKLLHDSLKRKMARLARLPHTASNASVATELSRRTGADGEQYKDVLDRCDDMLTRPKLSERELLMATKQLARMEMEIFDGHQRRK
jgi:Domain of unknown function (DUF4350)